MIKVQISVALIVDASDDVSGVDFGYVDFECESTGKYLRCSVRKTYLNDQGNEVNYADEKLHGTLKFDQYVESGVFVIREIKLQDVL